jgi:hypothetical protein
MASPPCAVSQLFDLTSVSIADRSHVKCELRSFSFLSPYSKLYQLEKGLGVGGDRCTGCTTGNGLGDAAPTTNGHGHGYRYGVFGNGHGDASSSST